MNIYNLLQKPEIYRLEESIWTDKYIAEQMLHAHLDNNTDAASYNSTRMQKVKTYLYDKLKLHSGANLLDLGCGPGLYSHYFAQNGVHVTGIDISETSIQYAIKHAIEEGVSVSYLVQDYRESFGENSFDAAICIYEDYGVMSTKDRKEFLENSYRALKAGGRIALDVASFNGWDDLKETTEWYTQEKGFFRPHPHTVLFKKWLYPEERVFCDMHVVLDDKVCVYHVYQTLFTKESLEKELNQAGFTVTQFTGGLDGRPFEDNSGQIGVIAVKE